MRSKIVIERSVCCLVLRNNGNSPRKFEIGNSNISSLIARERANLPELCLLEPGPTHKHMPSAIANDDFMIPSGDEALECVSHRDQGIDGQGQREHSEEKLEVPNPLFHNLRLVDNMLDRRPQRTMRIVIRGLTES